MGEKRNGFGLKLDWPQKGQNNKEPRIRKKIEKKFLKDNNKKMGE